MSQANMDQGIFQGIKLTDKIYTCGSAGYIVHVTDMPGRHHGRPHFAMEDVQQFGTNVVGFQLLAGERRWYIVVCYLAPDDTSTIEIVVVPLKEGPRGEKLLVAGYFNVNLP